MPSQISWSAQVAEWACLQHEVGNQVCGGGTREKSPGRYRSESGVSEMTCPAVVNLARS